MKSFLNPSRLVVLLLALVLTGTSSWAAVSKSKLRAKRSAAPVAKKSKVRATKQSLAAARNRSPRARKFSSAKLVARTGSSKRSRWSAKARRNGRVRYVAGGPWSEPNYADSTLGDQIDGEDLTVRRAAVEALGPYNGSVVVVDPESGRILTIVNQKVAFRPGFQPCSTVKIYAALAGLNEGLIDGRSAVRLYGRTHMNLTDALARSNNPFFANIGVQLGYDKIAYYTRLYGLGEKATLNVSEEQSETIPGAPPANGGMGMMTSFGEGIRQTPLQLAATLSAIANGGTLYYLQYPRSLAELENFKPQMKRRVPMERVSELSPGMLGATEYGTARRAFYDPNEPIFGKTGTCTDRATPTHLGWFGSFNEVNGRKLVVVVLLTGGGAVNGPVASGVAGQIYRSLSQQHYFAGKQSGVLPLTFVTGSGW